MKKLFGLVLLLTVFFWASSVAATIRYVDRDFSCPGSGTTGSPYCNIQNAMDVAVAGDFIRIRDSAGAYTGTINSANSGTAGNPIIIEPDTGHNPTMLVMFNMFNVSYVTIRNLRWDACSTSISPMSAIHWEAADTSDVVGIEISGNTINCWGGTNQSSARSNDQGDISLRSNYSSPFSNLTGLVTNNTLTGGLLNAMTITMSGAPSGATLTVSNNTISGTRCGLSSDGYRYLSGITIGGGNSSHQNRVQLINNTITDLQGTTACIAAIPSPPTGFGLVGGGIYCDAGHFGDLVDGNLIHGIDWSTSSGSRAHGIFWENRCSNAQLSRNVIYDVFSDDGSGIQMAGNSSCSDSDSNKVWNNTVYNTSGFGGFAYWHFAQNTDVANNIFVQSSGAAYGVYVEVEAATVCTGNTWRNNTFYKVGGGTINYQWGTTATTSIATWRTLSGDSQALNTDPLFVNAAAHNFTLQSSSPAKDSGVNVGLSFNGSAPDRGRYELAAGGVTRYVHQGCTGTAYNPAGAGSCTGGSATVYSTIQAGINATASGDILDIRAGTYSEHLNQTGWSSGSYPGTTVRGHAGEPVIIFAPNDYQSVCLGPGICGALDTSSQQYVTYQNLKFNGFNADGIGVVYIGRNSGSNHIRLDGVEIYNCGLGKPDSIPGACLYTGETSDYVEFINGSLHDSGTTTNNHAFGGPAPYCSYWGASNALIENNDIYNCGGFGLHIYNLHSSNLDNIVINRNRIWNTGIRYWQENGSGPRDSCAILHSNGHNIKITNNLIRGGSTWDRTTGICSAVSTAINAFIANNTVTGFNYTGGAAGSSIGIDNSTSTGTIAENNISSDNANNFVGPATYSNNLCSANGTGCDSTLTETPTTTFVNTSSDWNIRTGSKAIGAGLNLSSSMSAVDINNTARTAPWDIGAYKYGVAPTCPSSPPNALVASYGFEGNGNDSSGVNTATLGSGWSYTPSGKSGQGAVSTGVSGITVADADALDPCNGFTYEGWINLPNNAANYIFIVKNPSSRAFLFASLSGYCGSGMPVGGYNDGTGDVVACYGTPLTSGFKHLAVTYDATLSSGNIKLYINGSLVTQADGTALLTPTTGTLQFCSSGFGETCPSGTVIDDIRIYNYARTGAQIITDRDTAVVTPALTAPTLKLSGIMKFGASAAALKLNQQ